MAQAPRREEPELCGVDPLFLVSVTRACSMKRAVTEARARFARPGPARTLRSSDSNGARHRRPTSLPTNSG